MSALRIEMPNGSSVIMYPNTKIKVQLKSPLFQKETDPPSRTFNFPIPKVSNEYNLNFYTNYQSRVTYKQIEVKLYLCGSYWTNALLDVTDYNESDIKIRLLIDKGFYYLFGQKSLQEFKYNDPYMFRFYTEQLASSSYFFDDSSLASPCTITFNFYKTDSTSLPDQLTQVFSYNPASETLTALITRICAWFNDNIYDYRYYLEPVLPLANDFVIYNLTGPTNPEFYFDIVSSDVNFIINNILNVNKSTLASANAFYQSALTNPDRDCICLPIAAPDLFTTENPNYFGYLNFYKPKIAGNINYPGSFFSADQPLAPQPNLKYIIYKIHEEFNISIASDDFFTDEEIKQLYLYNSENVLNTIRRPRNGWRYSTTATFFYNDITPAVLVKDVLKALKVLFSVIFDYNSRDQELKIRSLKNILKSEDYTNINGKVLAEFSAQFEFIDPALLYSWGDEKYLDEYLPDIIQNQVGAPVNFKSNLPAIPVGGYNIVKATKENKYYKYNFGTSQWDLYAEGLHDFNPTRKDEYPTGSSPLFTLPYPWSFISLPVDLPYDVKWLLPATKTQGNQYPTDEITPTIKLFFYRGMRNCQVQTTNGGSYVTGTYPFGSSHNYDYSGNKVGNYSLAFSAEDGLDEKFNKEFIALLQATYPFKLKLDYNYTDIITLDILKQLSYNNQAFLTDTVDFTIGEDNVEDVVFTSYINKKKYD